MDENIKEQVREFYDRIGWSQIGEGLYQNARYEDLRPVSREYIHRCHLRLKRHITPQGDLFLDAGSGPVQYPEYLSYSEGYRHRVCADLSITALREARQRLGDHGLYVVADVAHLPFRSDAFDAVISLHTLHHLPPAEQVLAYQELHRVLKPGRTMVVVNGWQDPLLMRLAEPLIRLSRWLSGRGPKQKKVRPAEREARGTFVTKITPANLRRALSGHLDFTIHCWRSLSTPFLRHFVRPPWGKAFLRLIFWLEERFPRFFGTHGQYPLLVFRKPPSSHIP